MKTMMDGDKVEKNAHTLQLHFNIRARVDRGRSRPVTLEGFSSV